MASDSPVTQLYRALKDRDDAAFERLLARHSDLPRAGADRCVAPPLIAAAMCGGPRHVRRLLDLGADPELRDLSRAGSTHNMRALEGALWVDRADVADVLVEAGTREDLGSAIFRRDVDRTRAALDADPELLGTAYMLASYGLLHVAATLGHAGLTALFLERGLPPDAEDAAGHAPMRYAARNTPALDVLEHLVAAGADVNHRSRTGVTALSAACRHARSLPSVQWLLAHGADPNLVPDNRKSPLMKAAGNRVPGMVAALLAHGADPTYVGARKETALDVARRRKAPEVVALLEAAT